MKPIRIGGPVGSPITIEELRMHLDADPNDRSQDLLYQDLAAEAVSKLDGWQGILGRSIMPSEWQEEFDGWGVLRLSLPDVVEANVFWIDGAGEEQPADEVEVLADDGGSLVQATGPAASRVIVRYTAALSEAALPSIRAAIKLYVRHNYDNRGAADPKVQEYFDRAFMARVDHLIWGAGFDL